MLSLRDLSFLRGAPVNKETIRIIRSSFEEALRPEHYEIFLPMIRGVVTEMTVLIMDDNERDTVASLASLIGFEVTQTALGKHPQALLLLKFKANKDGVVRCNKVAIQNVYASV